MFLFADETPIRKLVVFGVIIGAGVIQFMGVWFVVPLLIQVVVSIGLLLYFKINKYPL